MNGWLACGDRRLAKPITGNSSRVLPHVII
jgi:hypothetical protein